MPGLLGNYFDQHFKGVDHVDVAANAAYTVKLTDRAVNLHSTSAATPAVTLPSVAEAEGMLIGFILRTESSTGTYTVQDADDSHGWSDAVFTAANDHLLLLCLGGKWWKLVDVTT